MDFYSEFRKLVHQLPRPALQLRNTEHCYLGENQFRVKNSYFSNYIIESQDTYYSNYVWNAKDAVDCLYVSTAELVYECIDCTNITYSSFLQNCHQCSNCDFSFDCINCKNCFGCFGLRNQQFCIFNKAYSEEEYTKKIVELKKQPAARVLAIMQEEFDKHPRPPLHTWKADRSRGDYLFQATDCIDSYNIRHGEGLLYSSNLMSADSPSSSCVDCTFGMGIQDSYECENCYMCTGCSYLENCSGCIETWYSINCSNVQNSFGCVNLENKQYCILNRQFTRDEYLIAVQKIMNDLKERNVFGKTLAEILN